MRYSEFEYILLEERLKRYLLACDGDTRKTMALYRLDLNLSHVFYAEVQYNNTFMFNELYGINILRNRIAHHEPICFALRQTEIGTSYILNAYQTLHKLFMWMGIDSHSLLYGLDHVQQVGSIINQLKD